MLPEHLSTNLCSLLPGQDRLTISLFIKVKKNGEIVGKAPLKSIINSTCRVSYTEIENILAGCPCAQLTENLKTVVKNLNKIAHIWRTKRLGISALYHSFSGWSTVSPRAHCLVEEFMFFANSQVAEMLKQRYPLTTPIKTQLPPSDIELDKWKEEFTKEARNTVAFTRLFKPIGEICRCSSICTCIPPEIDEDQQTMDITKSIWHAILKFLKEGNMNKLESLVVCPDHHPQLSVAMMFFQFLLDKSKYICSGDVPSTEHGHYSLNIVPPHCYTHFTSPIRRYMDLVVHRLLSTLISDQVADYSQAEISKICIECNDADSRAKRYKKETFTAEFCCLLQENPIVLNPFVAKFDNDYITLNFFDLRPVIHSKINIITSSLHLANKPVVENNSHIVLNWSQRIYDLDKRQNIGSKTLDQVELNSDRSIVKTSSSNWRKLLNAVKEKNSTQITNAIKHIENNLVEEKNNFIDELTSEGVLIYEKKHFCDYTLKLHRGSVVSVQLSVEISRGLLTPCIQLLSLTPLSSVCIEHCNNPVKCFANIDSKSAQKQTYLNTQEYQNHWLPVMAMESAYSSVVDGITSIVHHVKITWQVLEENKIYVGFFNICRQFCIDRFIQFPFNEEDEEEEDDEMNVVEKEKSCFGYICVRYPNLPRPVKNTISPLDRIMSNDQLFTWVGHCTVTKVTLNKNQNLKVCIKLNQSSSVIPVQLLTNSTAGATIEWISMTLPNQ